MPISNLDTGALERLTNQQLADLALAADQERRACRCVRNIESEQHWEAERDRLLAIVDRRFA